MKLEMEKLDKFGLKNRFRKRVEESSSRTEKERELRKKEKERSSEKKGKKRKRHSGKSC
ncbi:hypothetical protein ACJBV2_10390 [Streptococcus suis]